MKYSSIVFGLAAVGISAAIIIYVDPWNDPATTQQVVALEQTHSVVDSRGDLEAAQLRHAVAAMQSQLLTLKQQLSDATSDNKKSDTPLAIVNAANASQMPDEELRAAEEEQRRVYMVGVADAFQQERVDTTWAPGATSAVKSALESDEVLNSLTRSVDCRERSCRVEIDDDSSGSLMKKLPLLANQLAQELPSVTAEHMDIGGRDRMVLYMSRDQEGGMPAK